MIKKIPVPSWLFILDSVYRNRITFFNSKFENETNITFIKNDLSRRGVILSYVHLSNIIKILSDMNLLKRSKHDGDLRSVYVSLTFKGEDFIKNIDCSVLYDIYNNKDDYKKVGYD